MQAFLAHPVTTLVIAGKTPENSGVRPLFGWHEEQELRRATPKVLALLARQAVGIG